MTRRKMLLLIIGSLITVSTAVGVGVNYAIGSGSSQESSSLIKEIDISSPITRDGEETDVIDKKEDKSPSSPPAKVEINDKRKVSTPTKVDEKENKDKQDLTNKQTTPPTNSPVVVRKEGGTSDTNNKGTQLIIGDVSKLNLPQKENKEESKDSKLKPAVVIIKDTPTRPQTKEVEKNEEKSNPGEQKPTGAPVVVVGKPQPQQTSPQEKQEEKAIANKSNEQQTQGESSQQGSEIQVQVPQEKQTEEPISPESQPSQPSQPSDIDGSESDSTSPTQIELTDNNEQEQNQENSIDTEPTFTESQIIVLNAINDFKKVQNSYDLDEFIKNHTIRPDQAHLFFANIPNDWIRNDEKQNWLRRFWRENIYKVSNDEAKRAVETPWYRQGEQYDQSPDNWFNRELGLRDRGELNGQIISGADSFLVKGVPPKLKQPNDGTA